MTSEIRANTIKNRVGLGTVSYTDTGIVVSGIVTANSFTGNFTGDLDVDGHTNLDNVSIAGVTTTNTLHVAANNTTVGAAITQSGSGDILKLYDGTSEVFTVANQDDGVGAVTISSPKPRIVFNETNASPDYQIRMNGGNFSIHDSTNDIGKISISPTRTDINNPVLLNNDTVWIGDKLVHWTDDDTAIRFPAADTISMETGGSARFRIEPAGSIGIGSAIHHLNDPDTKFGFPSNDAFLIKIANDTRFYVSNSTAVWNRKDVSAGVGTCTMLLNYNNAAGSGVALAFGPSSNYSVRHSSIEVVNDDGNNNMSMRFKVTDASVNDHALERMRITKDGSLLVGTKNIINSSPSKFQVAATNATGSAILSRFNASVYSSYLDFYKSRSNTLGTAYVVNDDDHLGSIRFYGADGSNSGYTTAAEIYGSCDGGSGSSGDMPGRITFHTRPDGAGQSMQERLRLDSSGNVTVKTNDVTFGGSGTLRINSGSTSGVLNLDGGATNHGGEINLFGGSNGGRILFRTGQGAGQQGEKMRLDENGRLLIGGTSASYAFSGGDDLIIGNTNSGTRSGITLVSNSSQDGGIYFSDGTSSGSAHVQGQIVYDHGGHYLRLYTSSDEKVRILGGTTDHVLQIRGGNNLSISDGAANQNFSGTYNGWHVDNHGNCLIGLNAHLNYSSGSGTHQWKQTNAHSTIGSAGMFIGGNGSGNNTDICFFANTQGSSAGTVFDQQSWKFRISNSSAGNTDITQNYNLRYLQRGYFKNDTNQQNANNFPLAAGSGIGGYSWGYQEAFSTSNGSWVHPYPNLVLGYHTGMMFGGNYGYGGMRFFADHPSSNNTLLFSVGNGNTNCHVVNSLSKGGGSFRIAHPHPSKKYTHDLVHSFIEGPQCDNIYRGRVMLVNGSKTINIDTVSNMTDGTFVLLNRDIQCFTSNESGWTPVKGTVSGNILTITAQDNSCTDTISWMVIGERQDDKIKSLDMTDKNGDLIVEPLTIEETHM